MKRSSTMLYLTTKLLPTMMLIFVIVPFALAQEPTPLEYAIIPQADVAATGEMFEYTIVVTNSSSTPVREVVISAGVPDGARFMFADDMLGWRHSDPVGPEDRAIWFLPGEMQPGEVAKLKLVVEVIDDLTLDVLTNDVFLLLGEENLGATGSGPSLDVPVRTPTTVLNPTPSDAERAATNSALLAVTAERETAEAEATELALANRTATPTSTPTVAEEPTVEPTTAGSSDETGETTSSTTETSPDGGFLPSCLTGMMMLGPFAMVVAQRRRG